LIKIEVFDPDTAAKVTLTVDGAIPEGLSDSIGRYISEVLSASNAVAAVKGKSIQVSQGTTRDRSDFSSTFDRVKSLLLKHFRYGSFSSRDVQEEFERAHGKKLGGSTVSTYLLRLSDPASGILDRRRGMGGYEYLMRSEQVKDPVSETEKVRSYRRP
jgi:hypothetical protein